MKLNFKLQRNEEDKIQKQFARQLKRQNRHYIVAEMIEVKKAQKEAEEERNRFYTYKGSKAAKKKNSNPASYEIEEKKEKSALSSSLRNFGFTIETLCLYFYYTALDTWDYLGRRRSLYIAMAGMILILIISGFAINYASGYEVTLNGFYLGVVSDLDDLEAAFKNVDANLAEWYENENMYYEKTITLKRTFIKDRASVLDERGCEQAIYGCDFSLYVNGGVVLIDGVETVKLASKESAQSAVDTLISNLSSEKSAAETFKDMQIEQDIEVEERIIEIDSVQTVSSAVNYMQSLSASVDAESLGAESNSEEAASTEPTDPNAVSEPSDNTNNIMTALTFRQNSIGASSTTSKPVLTIKTVKEIVFTEDVPYDINYTTSAALYIGTTEVTSKGVNGTKKVTALVSYVNGEEESRVVLNEEVIVKPVSEVIAQGTKDLPPAVSTGTFVMPTSGQITTIYGSSSHAGGCAIDIANGTGTNIYASDSGVVTRASAYTTYGNCIVINHGNGYSTLYAHLSKFKVQVGDQVQQGQAIGLMGSTGYSTGPHLHFEIRYNNVRQKIERYFSGLVLGNKVKALQ